VIKLLGAGFRDDGKRRCRFLVLEYLELGTLADGVAAGVRQGHSESKIGRLLCSGKK
jgi:hypothetical protein